jgi:rubrerythrin
MPDTFTIGELINVAINIERSGITFFDIMARTTDSDVARDTFEQFVQMEREHLTLFQDMISQMADSPSPGALTPEVSGYIRALIDGAVFSNDTAMDNAVSGADTDSRALDVGINAEKDSILFYQALKDVMPPGVAKSLDGILAEEKTHLSHLSEIKKKIEYGG